MDKIKLTDLISVDVLQQIQDGFSRYTGMAALTTDSDGIPVTKGSGFTRFCMELTRKSKLGCKNCEQCDRDGALLTLEKGHATVYDCHAGLVDFAAPIMVEGMFIGSFIGGQVRTEEVNENRMRVTAEKYGIDPDEYICAAKQTECLPKDRAERAAYFLEEIAAALSAIAFRNYKALQESVRMEKAAKSQADFVMNMSMNLEHAMESWFNIVENTKNKTNETKIYDLLSTMQDDGLEMRTNIRDTIDYIRASASKVEISETEYRVSDLMAQLSDVFELITEGNDTVINLSADGIADCRLFGDSGRIGQTVNKVVRTICEKKNGGSIDVSLSVGKRSYATMLYITVTDSKKNYTDDDIKLLEEHFVINSRSENTPDVVNGVRMSLEGVLLKNMSGTLSVDTASDDITVKISVPQLALQEGR